MALIFDRPNFKQGKTVVRERMPALDADGKQIEEEGQKVWREKEYRFSPNDKGKSFEFYDEKYVLERYPILFKKA